ncbi:MAG: carbamoylphosphate synthase large subunit [Schwartzia sp.]|nr:carbamoylphosphate synthase large subunit [Schwartzia sp. (in: firmicutes)]
MNFIYISPQFPRTNWYFCERLRNNGVTVLGIGDTPYDELPQEIRSALNEYYYLDSLEDYDKVFRAVAFFSFKYGKIDWIESNNEYWLELDAKLRTDFNVATGVHSDYIFAMKSKALMKKQYMAAGIKSARQEFATDYKSCKKFIDKVGFPVIVKPEIGVGATDTWKLCNEKDLTDFFNEKPSVKYVIEEFVDGNIYSYDAIVDSNGDPLFESMTVWPPSIMDIVIDELDLAYYVSNDMPDQLRELGRAAVKMFHASRRFVHLEFFRLNHAQEGLGKAGDFVGLEVNMRPAGGYTPDMMNYAHSTDVYQIWADMVAFDKRHLPLPKENHCCAYAGRRDRVQYRHSEHEIFEKYGSDIVMCERLPEMMVPQMGNKMYTAKAKDEKAAQEFIKFVETRA